MSTRRLVATAVAMALIAGVLAVLTPGLDSMTGTLADPQRTADTAGADVLVLSAAGLAAWAVWAWGALGLILTAASVLPGRLGDAARVCLHVVLPAGARRSAALALGLGIGIAGPLPGTEAPVVPLQAAAAAAWVTGLPTGTALDQPAAPNVLPVPDWPVSTPQGGPPDWPRALPTAAPHLVLPGDCLWRIAHDRLALQGHAHSDGEVAGATRAWWRANAAVIGPDPDLLIPGQLLSPPDPN